MPILNVIVANTSGHILQNSIINLFHKKTTQVTTITVEFHFIFNVFYRYLKTCVVFLNFYMKTTNDFNLLNLTSPSVAYLFISCSNAYGIPSSSLLLVTISACSFTSSDALSIATAVPAVLNISISLALSPKATI